LGERTIKHSDTSLCDLDTSICEETLNIGGASHRWREEKGIRGKKARDEPDAKRRKEIGVDAKR
jgi:hypothetical protein